MSADAASAASEAGDEAAPGSAAGSPAEPAGRFTSLFAPVDAASLAVFRIAFGAIMLWEVVRYLSQGKIRAYFLEPTFHFTYAGFGWVAPPPGWGLYAHFGALGLCALALAVGYRQRLAAALFCLGFSYVFLLEKGRYLNHYYLVILLAALLVVVPADRTWSWAAWRRGTRRPAPAWALGLLRAQVGLVYFFAGIAKLNVDWLAAQPLTVWLSDRSEGLLLSPLLVYDWSPWLFSYGGLLLDLLAWPMLVWRRTRLAALAATTAFHLANASLFGIGMFPWMMIAATTLFLEPGWPRRLIAWLRESPAPSATAPAPRPAQEPVPPPRTRRLVVAFLVLYLGFQCLFPLRHFLYPGRVSWTEEGHAFAWHMKLRGKRGEISYRVRDPATGEQWLVDPAAELTSWQVRKMAGRPDMILQFAHHLARREQQRIGGPVEVRAATSVSLNSRPAQPLVDPSVDLAGVRWGLGHSPWILPLR